MLGRTLFLLGTAFAASRVVEAVTCRPNTIPYNGECLCLTSSAVDECTYTQDCSYTNGCECNRAECSCGSGHCKDVGLCNAVTGRCKCGNAGKLCLPEETCFLDMCICDKETFKICQGGTTCRNKQCYCGQRVCGAEEVCVAWPTPYCACGNFPRMCEANEVCEFDGYNFYCKCGGRVCGTEEKCEYHNGSYSCTCDDNVCDEHELCIKPYPSDPPFCICGKKECAANERCGVVGTTKSCLCGKNLCQAPITCRVDGTCVDPTSTMTTTSVITTEMQVPVTGNTGCFWGDEDGRLHCYNFSLGAVTFSHAQKLCTEWYQSNLVSIMSVGEQSFVESNLTALSNIPYWIGLVRLHDSVGSSVVYRYKWMNSGIEASTKYTNWDSGYPNNNVSSFDCVAANLNPNSRGKWRNTDCNSKLSFVCIL